MTTERGPGEHDLARLLRDMVPVLDPEVYVFVTVREVPEGVAPRMMFHEAEGITLILTRDAARAAGLEGVFPSQMITLDVHSALDAVGFLAHVATRLAGAGMGVNPVAGFYHDHLFVPEDRAGDAMDLLRDMAV